MENNTPTTDGLEVRSYFVRHRNALLARADFGELYVDYYLHLSENKIKVAANHDLLFKETLAALTLYLASRPHDVMAAWTVNFQSPPVNIFAVGDNETRSVTGRVFSENVKRADHNFFHANVLRGVKPSHSGSVEFTTGGIFAAVEQYCLQNEKSVTRFFQFAEEDYVMISAQPDCDLDWLNALTNDDIRTLDQREQLRLLEQRRYRWHCGCDEQRMTSLLASQIRRNPTSFANNEPPFQVDCPRCGAQHTVSREALEKHL